MKQIRWEIARALSFTATCAPKGTDLSCESGPTFASPATHAVVPDVDGDGRPDVITLTPLDPATSYDTANDGEVIVLHVADAGELSVVSRLVVPQTSSGCSGFELAAGDFDGDGHVDVAYVGESRLVLLAGHGDGTFAAPSRLAVDAKRGASIHAADRDGVADLAVGDYGADESGVYVFMGTRAGSPRPLPRVAIGDRSSRNLAVADLDGDGKIDLAILPAFLPGPKSPDSVQVFLGDGRGGFRAGAVVTAGANPELVTAGDFDEDGTNDLAVASFTSAEVSVILGEGGGAFRPQTKFGPLGESVSRIFAADFDGDGHLDLVAGTDRHVIFVFAGHGDGTFAPPRSMDPARASTAPLAVIPRHGSSDLLVSTGVARTVVPRGRR